MVVGDKMGLGDVVLHPAGSGGGGQGWMGGVEKTLLDIPKFKALGGY